MTPEQFGQWMRVRRGSTGMTMEELEIVTGVSRSTLKRMEGGSASASMGNVLAVVSALGGKLAIEREAQR